MCKNNNFSIVFLPEFLLPSLKELNITMVDLCDSIKDHFNKVHVERNLTRKQEVVKANEAVSDLSQGLEEVVDDRKNNVGTDFEDKIQKMIKFLGKSDLSEVSYLNYYLHQILGLEVYENNFSAFFSEILWGKGGSYNNEETCVSLIIKTLNNTNNDLKDFKDTYSVVNNNGVITIILKNGFSNYIVGGSNTNTRCNILKDIIDSVNTEAIVKNSLGLSYSSIAGSLGYSK